MPSTTEKTMRSPFFGAALPKFMLAEIGPASSSDGQMSYFGRVLNGGIDREGDAEARHVTAVLTAAKKKLRAVLIPLLPPHPTPLRDRWFSSGQ